MHKTNLFTTQSLKEYKHEDCIVQYREFSSYKDIPDKSDFKLADLKYYIQCNAPHFNGHIIDIDSIYVEEDKRCAGVGSRALKEFCDNNSKSIITLTAGLHQKDESKLRLITNDDDIIDAHRCSILERLTRFYNSHDFIDVNDFIGNYYSMHSMILANETFYSIGGTELFTKQL